MAINRAMLDAVGAAATFDKAAYLRDGRYALVLDELIYDSFPKAGITFVARVKILEAVKSNPAVEPNAPGTSSSWTQPVSKQGALGRIKKFYLAAFDLDKAVVESRERMLADIMEMTIGQNSKVMRGWVVDAEGYQGQTQKGDKQTWFNFASASTKNDPEQLKARGGDPEAIMKVLEYIDKRIKNG